MPEPDAPESRPGAADGSTDAGDEQIAAAADLPDGSGSQGPDEDDDDDTASGG
ncbi:MAG: hypothetical protein RI885_2790 [Actinomycetota bacterium]